MIIGFLSGGFIGLVAGIRIAKQGSTGKRSMSWVVKRNVEDNSHVSWRKPKSIY